MKKWLRALLLVLVLALIAFTTYLYRTLQLGRDDAQTAFLENLNPRGEFLGPEGIQFDPAGNLLVGDGQGIVWDLGQGGNPRVYARLAEVTHELGPEYNDAAEKLHAGGMDFDLEGNLYVCVYGFAGGAVLRVDAKTHRVRLFARDLGVANYLVITQNRQHLWVSDYRPRGRLLRFKLGEPIPAEPDRLIEGLVTPNGLALGKDDQVLYAAETDTGNIVRVGIASEPPDLIPMINIRGTFAVGSLDGLAFDPRDKERRFLYVAENLRGMFTVVDLKTQPVRVVKRLRMALMGGRPCPASMVIRDGYLYFTDLWAANPFRIVLGFPKLHTHAFRFPVKDLSTLY